MAGLKSLRRQLQRYADPQAADAAGVSGALYWTPVIAPAGLAFYEGDLFPAWKGSALIGGLKTQTLSRVTITGNAAHEDERFAMEERIQDAAVAPMAPCG